MNVMGLCQSDLFMSQRPHLELLLQHCYSESSSKRTFILLYSLAAVKAVKLEKQNQKEHLRCIRRLTQQGCQGLLFEKN